MIWGKDVIFLIWHVMLQSDVMASWKMALAFRYLDQGSIFVTNIYHVIYIEVDTHSMYIDVYICA
jgi:hypothetical protein